MSLSDQTTNVAQLKAITAQFSRERDWEQFHAPKNLSMAIAAETGELLEHFLWVTPDESRALLAKPDKRAKVEEELADIVILALQFANVSGIDVAQAVEAKIARNAQKYPVAKAKGKSDKYTEL